MPALTDNEARAIIYFAIGVSSEGGDQAYRLAFAGTISHDAQGNAILAPVAASGYSIGTLQNDLGQSGGVVATQLIDAYQTWATRENKDWVLDEASRARTIADLSRNGHPISDRDHGRDLDAAIKSHVNAFLRSDEGVSFVRTRATMASSCIGWNAERPASARIPQTAHRLRRKKQHAIGYCPILNLLLKRATPCTRPPNVPRQPAVKGWRAA
jgi:hypothetical protein